MKKSEILSLYKNVSLLDSIHMSVRYDRCPYDVLETYIPEKGRILDFGCGHGLMTNLMAVKSKDRDVIGLDPSRYKIEIAQRSINGRENIKFVQGWVANIEATKLRAVTVIDVLYLMSPDDQIALLKKILFCLDVHGVLVIKEVPAVNDLRFKVAYTKELIMVRVLKRTLGDKFFYRTEGEWENLLNEIGYKVKVTRLGTRAPSTLFVCERS